MGNNAVDILKSKSRCAERQKIVVSSENKLIHRACNIDKNLVAQYKVDGDIFTSADDTRADYLVLNIEKKNAYIIELEHGDIDKGIRQIIVTRSYFPKILNGFSFAGRLIYTSASHTVLNNLKTKKKRKEYNWIKISAVKYEENI